MPRRGQVFSDNQVFSGNDASTIAPPLSSMDQNFTTRVTHQIRRQLWLLQFGFEQAKAARRRGGAGLFNQLLRIAARRERSELLRKHLVRVIIVRHDVEPRSDAIAAVP